MADRWPPAYDSHTLQEQINRLREQKGFSETFYCQNELPFFCQGDIIRFATDFPFIDADGEISFIPNPDNLWLFAGNTCDFSKKTGDFKYTHICPVEKVPEHTAEELQNGFYSYSTYKRFYLPVWQRTDTGRGYFIDFTQMCSVERDGLIRHAQLQARMSRKSWFLFHSCLVRYLARDDGRHDPG